MEESLISFKTAKLAKEKGYSVGSKSNYVLYLKDYIYDSDPSHPESYKEGDITLFNMFQKNNHKGIDSSNENYTLYERPSQSLLQKWLRETHALRIFVQQGAAGNFIFNLHSFPVPNNIGKWERFNNVQSYNSYEEALEIGLQEALKLI